MKYAAMLRGIGPGNPNMRNEKLREVFEGLGFKNVRSVISSGNVLFETDSEDTRSLEAKIEHALPEKLGFNSTAIIRSQQQLKNLIKAKPYGDTLHSRESYLLVTFCKNPIKVNFELPYHPPDKSYQVVSLIDNTLFTVTDTTSVKTPDVMTWLEKQFGKEITSRTWLTINRILKRFEAQGL